MSRAKKKQQKLEYAVDGALLQIPTLVANNMTEWRTCSRTPLPWGEVIPASGLGGDSVMDRSTDAGRTDGQRKNYVALAHPYYEGK